VTKPAYQAASTRVAAPLDEVGAAPVVDELRVLMTSEVNEEVDVDETEPVPLGLKGVMASDVNEVVPFVAVAGWLLVVLVPGAVDECVVRGTEEDVGLLEMGKLDELA